MPTDTGASSAAPLRPAPADRAPGGSCGSRTTARSAASAPAWPTTSNIDPTHRPHRRGGPGHHRPGDARLHPGVGLRARPPTGHLIAPWPRHPGHQRDRTSQILGIGAIAIAFSVLWGDWWRPAHGWFVPIGADRLRGLAPPAQPRRGRHRCRPPRPGPGYPPPWQPTPPAAPSSVTPAPFPPAGVTEPPPPATPPDGDPPHGSADTIDYPHRRPRPGDHVDPARHHVLGADAPRRIRRPGVGGGGRSRAAPSTLPTSAGRGGAGVLGPIVFGALLLWGGPGLALRRERPETAWPSGCASSAPAS